MAEPEGEFAGKVAIVTGAASYIGEAIAAGFVAAGGAVVLVDVDATWGTAAADRLGDATCFVAADVTDDAALDDVVDTACGAFGGIDVLVHAAAIFDDDVFATSREQWHRVLDVNLVAAAVLTNKLVPHLEERGGGSIVYVASVSGKQSQPDRLVYPVTKAGLLALARNGSQQLAAKRIRVNAVSPGWVWSRNVKRRYGTRERADELGAELHPWGRMADPEEVAEAVLFLASERARFVTGADLAVDGGYGAIGPEAMGQPHQKVPPVA